MKYWLRKRCEMKLLQIREKVGLCKKYKPNRFARIRVPFCTQNYTNQLNDSVQNYLTTFVDSIRFSNILQLDLHFYLFLILMENSSFVKNLLVPNQEKYSTSIQNLGILFGLNDTKGLYRECLKTFDGI